MQGYRLPRWLTGKESVSSGGDATSIPGWGQSPGGGNSNPLQYSCLGKSMDRGTWQGTVHVQSIQFIKYMGLQRVEHNLATETTTNIRIHDEL